MAITISGENNNDRILASDGVIDEISGINIVGLLTAGHINVGNNIQLGNAGIITATTFIGNVTGNVNSTSPLLLQTDGGERFRITGNNELGIAGGNYGSAGQVLTSGGSGSAVSWTTPAVTGFTNGSNNRVVTATSGSGLNGESALLFNGYELNFNVSGSQIILRGAGVTKHELVAHSSNNDLAFVNNRDAGNVTSDIVFKGSGSGGGTISEKMRITTYGVGINHNTSGASTNAALTIKNRVSSSATRFNLVNSGSSSVESTQIYSQNNDLLFVAGAGDRLRIKSDGDFLTQGLTSASFDNQGSNGRKYEFTGDGTAGKFPVINISGNSNTDGGTIGVLRFVNRENANSSSGSNNQSKSLVEFDVRSTTSDSNAGDDSGGYVRIITKSEEGQLGERFRLTARGSFKSNGRHNLGGIREITSGTLANGESVSWNGSGTTYTNGALNWNSIGGNGGAWIGSLSVLSADQAPSGAMVLVGCHGSGFNTYNMLVNQFDSGISVTPTGTGASSSYWNSVITNTSGETIYYRMLVYHLGASTETIFGL